MSHSLEAVAIPYGAYWSTPFCKWQKSLSHLHSIELAAHVARNFLQDHDIDPKIFDLGVLGITVPQIKSFWGVPWLMSKLGNAEASGPTISQACATSVRSLSAAAAELVTGSASTTLIVACDRTSNGPVLVYPDAKSAGGAPTLENWVLDNFALDPTALVAMVETAENVAREMKIDMAEQHEVALIRYQQYLMALENDKAFLRRFMRLPFPIPDQRFTKTLGELDGDEGITPTSKDALARLKPVISGGTVTYGAQTHPADANAGMIVTTVERAHELSTNPTISIKILAFGQARERQAYMPLAPVKATSEALAMANLKIGDIDIVKSHNPFAVNDIAFSRKTGFPISKMNNFGCSLVYGHPQGPTGLRGVIEMIEELAIRGGGRGLFQGCAAGDTGMAIIIEVSDA